MIEGGNTIIDSYNVLGEKQQLKHFSVETLPGASSSSPLKTPQRPAVCERLSANDCSALSPRNQLCLSYYPCVRPCEQVAVRSKPSCSLSFYRSRRNDRMVRNFISHPPPLASCLTSLTLQAVALFVCLSLTPSTCRSLAAVTHDMTRRYPTRHCTTLYVTTLCDTTACGAPGHHFREGKQRRCG